MLRTYIANYIRANQASVISLAALSFIASVMLGLVVGVGSLVVRDYLIRMEYLGETPSVTGSSIAFAIVTALCSISIVLMLKSAFDVSMSARMRNLGLLKTAGASDSQVRLLLLAEGCALSLPAALLGVLTGMALSLAVIGAILAMTAGDRVYEPVIELSPLSVALGLLVSTATIALSALLPAHRLGRISVIKAIEQGTDEYRPTGRPYGLLARLIENRIGIEAKLAACSLRSRKRNMRTANVSIACALLAFVTLINFETLSHLSTQATYFERYADVWDVRITVDRAADLGADDSLIEMVRSLDGVDDVSLGDPYKADSEDLFYNIRTESRTAEADVALQLEQRFENTEGIEVVSLSEEAERDERARAGLRLFVDVFASILALIGISDVFSSVLGRIPSRRREVSQMVAAGISRKQIRRMFTAESFFIIARPFSIAAILNIAIVAFAICASPVSASDFLTNMPIVHIATFTAACWLLVRLAYLLGEHAVFAPAE